MRPSIGQQVKSTPSEEIPVQNPQRPPRLGPSFAVDWNHARRPHAKRFSGANDDGRRLRGTSAVEAPETRWAAF